MAWFSQQWRQLLAFYREETMHQRLWQTAMAFLVLAVVSFAVGAAVPSLSEQVVAQFQQMVTQQGLAQQEDNVLLWSIFRNNLRAMTMCILYGLFPYLYLSALPLGINALLLGFMGAFYVNHGHSLAVYLLGVLPHGIFEITALLVAIACGLHLCAAVTGRLRRGEGSGLRLLLPQLLRVLLLQLAPLVLLAALIETYVTPVILTHAAG